jgi:hypothetical protein
MGVYAFLLGLWPRDEQEGRADTPAEAKEFWDVRQQRLSLQQIVEDRAKPATDERIEDAVTRSGKTKARSVDRKVCAICKGAGCGLGLYPSREASNILVE